MTRREGINLRSPVKIYEVEDQTVIEMREPTGDYVDLGYEFARYEHNKKSSVFPEMQHIVKVYCPSSALGRIQFQCVNVEGTKAITDLRDFLTAKLSEIKVAP